MRQMVDLTLELSDGYATYPGGPKLAIMNRITHEWTAGRYQPPAHSATDRILLTNEHLGTHVDAPFHFCKDGATIDEIDLEQFWGEAVLADVSDRVPAVPISPEQIETALTKAGEVVHEGDILLVRCWAGMPEEPGFLTATAFTKEVGAWAAGRKLKAVGVDLPSVDNPGDRSFPVHMALLPAGILIYEGLCNLQALAATRFIFLGLPLRVVGGSGSLVRAVAILDI